MKFVKEQIQQTINFSASNTVPLLIGARSYWIVGMLLDFEIAKTDGGGPTTYQDWLARGITNLSLTGGGRPYVRVNGPDLRSLYWGTRLRLRGRHRMPDLAVGAVTVRYQMPIIFGVNPANQWNDHLNLFDLSAGIAPDQDLTLQLTWSAAANTIGANRTIGAGALVRVTLIGIVPETKQEEPKYYPVWNSSIWDPAQAFAGKSGVVQLPTGFRYRRSTIVTLNGATPNDVRNDGFAGAAISEIGVKTADGRFPVDLRVHDFAQLSQGQLMVCDDNGSVPGAVLAPGVGIVSASYNPGVGMIDWSQIADTSDPSKADPLYGINLVNKETGTVALAFTVDTAANTRVLLLHECYAPY